MDPASERMSEETPRYQLALGKLAHLVMVGLDSEIHGSLLFKLIPKAEVRPKYFYSDGDKRLRMVLTHLWPCS